jgi:hypothetical protein
MDENQWNVLDNFDNWWKRRRRLQQQAFRVVSV